MTASRRATLGLVLACTTWFAAAAVPASVASPALLAAAVRLGFATGELTSAWRGWPQSVPPQRLAWLGARLVAVANVLPVVVEGALPLVASRAAVGASLALVYPSVLHLVSAGAAGRPGRALGAVIAALTIGSAGPRVIRAAGITAWPLLVATSLAVLAGGALIRSARAPHRLAGRGSTPARSASCWLGPRCAARWAPRAGGPTPAASYEGGERPFGP